MVGQRIESSKDHSMQDTEHSYGGRIHHMPQSVQVPRAKWQPKGSYGLPYSTVNFEPIATCKPVASKLSSHAIIEHGLQSEQRL